jgi:outer membrane protein OmpA-like peptidoglycan-associated protein
MHFLFYYYGVLGMASDSDDNLGLVLGVVIGAIVLVIALVFGVVIQKQATAAKPVAAAAPAADAASVVVENGVVKFYFATGKADLAEGAKDALKAAVEAVATGKALVVSGFHDSTGDAALNAELAKQRAFAVRDALLGLGVAQDKIELLKPENTSGSGSNAQARRVEVAVK